MSKSENDFNTLTIEAGAQIEQLANVTAAMADAYGTGVCGILGTLSALKRVEEALDQVRRAVVAEARTGGYTWQELGDTLGTTRQAAQERFK